MQEIDYVVFARGGQVINAGVVPPAARGQLPVAVTCVLEYASRSNGLPNDVGDVYKIEEKVTKELAAIGAVFVGHVLGSGRCRSYFYARRPAPSNVRVKVGLFKSMDVSLNSRQDPEWGLYESELRPTFAERAIAQSRPLLSTLQQQGDRPELSRTVDIAVLFPEESQRVAFQAELASADPSIRIGKEWTDDQEWHWLELHKTMGTDEASIGATCGMLMELAEKHGGEFDGWACPVMRG